MMEENNKELNNYQQESIVNDNIVKTSEDRSTARVDGNHSNQLSNLKRNCPFCGKVFKKLGNHLHYCHKREGRDYVAFLSQKTLTKNTASKKQRCPNCRRLLKRLDTHLRLSASCKHASASLECEPVTSSYGNGKVVSNISTAEHHPVRVSKDLPVSDHVTNQDTTKPSLPVSPSPSPELLPPSTNHDHSAFTPFSSQVC